MLIFVYGLILVRIAGDACSAMGGARHRRVGHVGSSLSRALTGARRCGEHCLLRLCWSSSTGCSRRRSRDPGRYRRIVEGRGIDLANDGALNDKSCNIHSVSRADIDEALRGSGVTRIEDTSRVTLEPSGRITVLK